MKFTFWGQIKAAFSSLVCSLDALSICQSNFHIPDIRRPGAICQKEKKASMCTADWHHCRQIWKMYWNVVWCHACDHPFRWRCRCGPTCQTLASLPSPARAYAGKAGFTDLWKLHHVCLLDLAAFNWHSRLVLFNLFHIYGLQMFHSEPRKLKWNPGVNPCLSCGAIVFCRLESAISQALSLRLDGRKSQKFSMVVKLRMQCSVGIQWITLWLVPLPSCGSRMLSVLLWHFMTSWHFHANFTELVQLSKCQWAKVDSSASILMTFWRIEISEPKNLWVTWCRSSPMWSMASLTLSTAVVWCLTFKRLPCPQLLKCALSDAQSRVIGLGDVWSVGGRKS